MTCHTCRHALMRSEAPKDKHYSYECCEAGVFPMVPQLPTGDHHCEMWQQGKTKQPQGIDLIFGEDIEL